MLNPIFVFFFPFFSLLVLPSLSLFLPPYPLFSSMFCPCFLLVFLIILSFFPFLISFPPILLNYVFLLSFSVHSSTHLFYSPLFNISFIPYLSAFTPSFSLPFLLFNISIVLSFHLSAGASTLPFFLLHLITPFYLLSSVFPFFNLCLFPYCSIFLIFLQFISPTVPPSQSWNFFLCYCVSLFLSFLSFHLLFHNISLCHYLSSFFLFHSPQSQSLRPVYKSENQGADKASKHLNRHFAFLSFS